MADAQNYTAIDDLIQKYKKEAVQSISVGKEGEPVSLKKETSALPEVTLDEAEAPQEKERPAEEYIENVDENIELDPQLKKAGLQAIDISSLSPFQRIQLPLSDEKIMEGKQKSVTSSWRWLAEFAFFMLGQAHITLKKIHGKVIRVLKR